MFFEVRGKPVSLHDYVIITGENIIQKISQNEKLRGKTLFDFMILPVQRIPRYRMLLQVSAGKGQKFPKAPHLISNHRKSLKIHGTHIRTTQHYVMRARTSTLPHNRWKIHKKSLPILTKLFPFNKIYECQRRWKKM